MSYKQEEDAGELIIKALKAVQLDHEEFGRYILEKVAEDRNILSVKDGIINENDEHKVGHNTLKFKLLKYELVGLILTKNSI